MNRYSILPFLDALNDLIRENLATYAPTQEPDLFLMPDGSGSIADWDYDSTLGAGLPFYTRVDVISPSNGAGAVAEIGVDSVTGAIDEVIILSPGTGYGGYVLNGIPYPRLSYKPFINHVYSNIPTVFSDMPPFSFLDYIKGEQRRDGFDVRGRHGSQMTHTLEWNVCQALAKDTTTADAMANTFVGVAYDFLPRHDDLKGTVDRATIISDRVETVEVNGGAGVGVEYLANIFTIQIERMVDNVQ